MEIPVLTVLHPRKKLRLRCPGALHLIRDEHPWHVVSALEQLAEKCLRRRFVPAALDEHIEDVAILIDGPPEIVAFAVHGENDRIQGPLVAGPGPPMPEFIRL